jgi:23S rRNA pseudouridine1911/1915/1917 synthase
VVGDRTYRRRGIAPLDAEFAARVASLGGPALHAAVLGFVHPTTGAAHRYEAPLPPGFTALMGWLRARAESGGPPSGVR